MNFLGLFGSQPAPPPPQPQPRVSGAASAEIDRWGDEFRRVIAQNVVSQGKQVIGINLGSSKNFQAEVEDIINSLKGSYAQYKVELENNKKEKMMNRALAKNFKSNLEVMVDVSNLLHSYMALFQTLRDELRSFNSAINTEKSDPNSLDYLQELTSTQIKNLQETFTAQSQLLQTYYAQNPDLPNNDIMKTRMSAAEEDVRNVVANAQTALTVGGNKKPKKPRKARAKKSI
jgi:hypothetical protein